MMDRTADSQIKRGRIKPLLRALCAFALFTGVFICAGQTRVSYAGALPAGVKSVAPAPGATGVPANGNIVVEFEQPVTSAGALSIDGQEQAGALSGGNTTFTTPYSGLADGVHKVLFPAYKLDDDIDETVVNFEWSFTVGTAVIENIAIVGRNPRDGQKNVPASGTIKITFSKAVTVTGSVVLDSLLLNKDRWFLSDDKTVLNIIYNNIPEGWHSVLIKDFGDEQHTIGNDIFWFETGASGGQGYLYVVSTVPAQRAVNVPVNGTVVINFSDRITRYGSVSINGVVLNQNRWYFSADGRTLYIPYDNLPRGNNRVRLTSFGDADEIIYDYTLEFDTGEGSGALNWIVKTVPADKETVLSGNGAVSVQFNRAMDTRYGNISLPGGVLGPASWSSDRRTVTVSYTGLTDGTHAWSGKGFRGADNENCPEFNFEFTVNTSGTVATQPPAPTPAPTAAPAPPPDVTPAPPETAPEAAYTPPNYYGERGVVGAYSNNNNAEWDDGIVSGGSGGAPGADANYYGDRGVAPDVWQAYNEANARADAFGVPQTTAYDSRPTVLFFGATAAALAACVAIIIKQRKKTGAEQK